MSGSMTAEEKHPVEGVSSDLSDRHPLSFASRMKQIRLDQGRRPLAQITEASSSHFAAHSNHKEVERCHRSRFQAYVGDKVGEQLAALGDVAGRSKRNRGEPTARSNLSGHHPLSFASRIAIMGAKEGNLEVPPRPDPSPAPNLPISPSSTGDLPLEPSPNLAVGPKHQAKEAVDAEGRFKKSVSLHLPSSVVVGHSRSFSETVSDARNLAKLVDFDDLPDSIGFEAEVCDVGHGGAMAQRGRLSKSHTTFRTRGSELQKISRGKPTMPPPSSPQIRAGQDARSADGDDDNTAGWHGGSDKR